MSVNKVSLVGNVGKDPEVRNLDFGKVAQFSLATSEKYTDKNGDKKEKTEWHNLVLWKGLADVAEKYVKKGTTLYVEGKITSRSYEKDGDKKYVTEIVVTEMKMITWPKEEGEKPTQNKANWPKANEEVGDETSDLPF